MEPPSKVICRICSNSNDYVAYNFGGSSCYACSAFFRRSVRGAVSYKCAADAVLCAETAVRDVTGLKACKKCRMDRCFREGLEAQFVREPLAADRKQSLKRKREEQNIEVIEIGLSTLREESTMLGRMVEAIQKNQFFLRTGSYEKTLYGTSETGGRYLSYRKGQTFFFQQLSAFRAVLDDAPILCLLPSDNRNQILKNVLPVFTVMTTVYYTTQHLDEDRFYGLGNVYVDIDLSKIIAYLDCNDHKAPIMKRWKDIKTMAGRFLSNALFILKSIRPLACSVLKSEEDLAVLVLISIIHTNCDSSSDPELRDALDKLKTIWDDVDRFYRSSGRSASTWGNLFILMSCIVTAAQDLQKFSRMAHMYYGSTLYSRLNQHGNLDLEDGEIKCLP